MTKPTKESSRVRAALETVSVELAVARMRLPMIRLRVEQAQRRGLNDLMSPALEDVDAVAQSMSAMQAQIVDALAAIGAARSDI